MRASTEHLIEMLPLKRLRWSTKVTVVSSISAVLCLIGAFVLLVSTHNVLWAMLLVIPILATGLLFGSLSGAVVGFALLVAAGLAENAIGEGLLHTVSDYLVAGLVVAFVGGSVGRVSGLYFERGRLLEELRVTLERARRDEKSIDLSEERYRNIFQNSSVSLWEEDISELKAELQRLKDAGVTDFRRYFEDHPNFVASAIQMTRVIDVNMATLELYGARSKEELLGSLDKTVDLGDPVLVASFRDTILAIAEGRSYYRGESTARTLGGKNLNIAVSSYIREEEEGSSYMLVNVMDITDRKHAEDRIVHLNRLYAVLSEINHVIARVRDRESLLTEVCRIAIDQGSFRMAWVGVVDEALHLLRPVASAGFIGTYLDEIRISTLDVPVGRGPGGRAVREGRAAAFGDMWNEPSADPWREAARQNGYRSCASVPLRQGDRVIGTFNVYSEEPWFFDEDQIGLIEEIGSDLSFALRALEEEANRRQAEETLRKSEARLRSVMESAADAVVIADGNDNITLWNVAAISLFGYNPEEIVGKPLSTIVPRELLARLETKHISSDSPGRTVRRESIPIVFAGTAKDGSEIDVEFTLAGWEVDGERHVTGIFRDVTERTRAEEKIREQAQLLDISSEAILVRDREGRVRYWNRGAERLYGWSAGEALGHDDTVLLRLPSAEKQAAVLGILQTGEWSGELHTSARDGQRLTVQASWTLLRDRSGLPNGVLVVCSDISEKKLSETQRLRNQRLESLGRLAGAIAHDLNNILTPVLGGMETLELEKMPESDRTTVGLIRSSVLRGANLIRQILTFASAGHGQYQQLSLAPLIEEVAGMVRGTLPKTTELQCSVAPGLWPINGDLTQIHQVVMNLCVNARDALTGGGSVSITAENVRPDPATKRMHIDALPIRYVHLRVEDTGVGIEPSVIENIFDPFFTTKEKGTGTGLGLATALSIVKSHGGFIDVHSEPGKGSRFDVYLPASDESRENRRTEPTMPVPRGNGELILVVDDESPIRTVISDILTAHGYRSVTAGSGVEALRIYEAQRNEIAAVMVDALMPHMDGIATIKAIKAINEDARLMIVSGLISHDQAEEARRYGVAELVGKPFTANDLLRSVHRLISD